jgi:hypothetical protein
MNGAITDPEVRTIIPPSSNSHMMIGKSQNFLRSLINDHISTKNSAMMPPTVITDDKPKSAIVGPELLELESLDHASECHQPG